MSYFNRRAYSNFVASWRMDRQANEEIRFWCRYKPLKRRSRCIYKPSPLLLQYYRRLLGVWEAQLYQKGALGIYETTPLLLNGDYGLLKNSNAYT